MMGIHVQTIKLKPGVTMDQFKEFILKTGIPDFEKNFKGAKAYLLEAVRGENANTVAFMYFFESENLRDMYFKDGGIDGAFTPLGKEANDKGKAVNEKLAQLVESPSTLTFTDWIVR